MDHIPVLSAIRTVGRFVSLPVIALPMLLALRWQRLPVRRGSLITLGAILLFEVLPPFGYPMLPVDPSVGQALASGPSRGAVLVIPATTHYRLASEHLYLSTIHRRPLVGNVALERATDPQSLRVFLETPVVRDLALLRVVDFQRPSIFGQDLTRIAPAAFAAHGIDSIVLSANTQRDLSPEEQQAIRLFLRETLGLSERQIAPGVFQYLVRPVQETDEPLVAIRGEGWDLRARSAAEVQLAIADRAGIEIFVAGDRPRSARLSAVSIGDAGTLVVRGPRSERQIALGKRGTPFSVDLGDLPPGFSSIVVHVSSLNMLLQNPRIVAEDHPGP